MIIVAAHQPNFLPWLGFFDRMRRADLFVIVDHVQFERQNFQNRTRIKAAEGPRWLTVPVRQFGRDERILDKRIDNSRAGRFRWGRAMTSALRYAYEAAPFYREHAPAVAGLLERDWERLLPLNLALIELCREALGIRTPLARSSQLGIKGAKSEMVLELCRATGADVYLAGAGGSRSYLDVAAFKRAGIEVRWQEFAHPTYRQCGRGGPFVDRLSALDLLFNCGAESGTLLGAGSGELERPVAAGTSGR